MPHVALMENIVAKQERFALRKWVIIKSFAKRNDKNLHVFTVIYFQ